MLSVRCAPRLTRCGQRTRPVTSDPRVPRRELALGRADPRRRPTRCRDFSGTTSSAPTPSPSRRCVPAAVRLTTSPVCTDLGRLAGSEETQRWADDAHRPPPRAAHPRPDRPPGRRGRLPPVLARPHVGRRRPRAHRRGLDAAVPTAARTCDGPPASSRGPAGRGGSPLPGLDDVCRRARAARRPRPLADRWVPLLASRDVRPGAAAARRQPVRLAGHGHDREAGRVRRPRQHHAGRADAGRARRRAATPIASPATSGSARRR